MVLATFVLSLSGSPKVFADETPSWDIVDRSEPRKPNVIANLLSLNSASQFGNLAPLLRIACINGQTIIAYVHGGVSNAENTVVEIRLANGQVFHEKWNKLQGGLAVGLDDWRFSVPFIERLSGADKITIQISDPKSKSSFDLKDIEPAIRRIATACNWN